MNTWVETALDYLPDEVYNSIQGKMAFTCLNSDACRLAPEICKHEEIIVISPWVLPNKYFSETDSEARYFIFCILHEVAHMVLCHNRPDEISAEENKNQEEDADTLALLWFNGHISEISTDIKKITKEEIGARQSILRENVEQTLNKC